MAVEIQSVDIDHPHVKQIIHAVNVLKRGGVIVYPTDTIYGLAADILSRVAVERIFKIKRVSRHKLLSLICADMVCVGQWAHISNQAFRVMRRVLPGKYTFIVPASQEVPRNILQKRRTVGVRIPDSAVVRLLVKELGRPLLSTSVPKGEDDYLTSPQEIVENYRYDIDLILDAGVRPNIPSTVIDFSVQPPVILREGAGDLSFLNLF